MPPLKGHQPDAGRSGCHPSRYRLRPGHPRVIGAWSPTEADPELLAAYRAGKQTLPLHLYAIWLSNT